MTPPRRPPRPPPGHRGAFANMRAGRPGPGFRGLFGLRRVGCVVSFALAMDISQLRAKIRDIKDFPTEGILYKDITTLLQDGPAWAR